METEQIMRSMKFILVGDDLGRVEITYTEDGITVLNLDLHGLSRKQASRMVKNTIAMVKGTYVLNVIHGFNHGTVLKEMIMEETWGPRVIEKSCPYWNPGQTYMRVAA